MTNSRLFKVSNLQFFMSVIVDVILLTVFFMSLKSQIDILSVKLDTETQKAQAALTALNGVETRLAVVETKLSLK